MKKQRQRRERAGCRPVAHSDQPRRPQIDSAAQHSIRHRVQGNAFAQPSAVNNAAQAQGERTPRSDTEKSPEAQHRVPSFRKRPLGAHFHCDAFKLQPGLAPSGNSETDIDPRILRAVPHSLFNVPSGHHAICSSALRVNSQNACPR